MKKKIKISLFVFIVIGVVVLNITYKNKNEVTKTKRTSQNNLAIMVKGEGSSDYTKSISKDIPKGNYTLNYEKSYCKNNGVIGDYDSTLGKVSFSFIGTDSCYLYFDYVEKIVIGNNELIVNTGTPDFSQNATTNEGVFKAEDDLGTSYYFRGAVDNNWLQYGEYTKDMYNCYSYNETLSETNTNNSCTKIASKGDKMYWRIIRINGDDSIRIIYSGVTAPTEITKVVKTSDTSLGNCKFNKYNVNNDSPEYAGYMYTIGEQHGTGTDSTIKLFLDDWYINYTNLNKADTKIVDQIYCNDRTASIDFGDIPGEIDSWVSKAEYFYGFSYRWGDGESTPLSPTLTCPNTNDKFTATTSKGNGKLDYPVGLITADEVVMAGSGSEVSSNTNYYLNTEQEYYTITPYSYTVGSTPPFNYISEYSGLSFTDPDYSLGVRPVISLSSSVKLSGDGTWNNVYTVS